MSTGDFMLKFDRLVLTERGWYAIAAIGAAPWLLLLAFSEREPMLVPFVATLSGLVLLFAVWRTFVVLKRRLDTHDVKLDKMQRIAQAKTQRASGESAATARLREKQRGWLNRRG